MTNPVVFITGGSRGIGAATAISAARAGYDVGITYQSAEATAQQVCEQVRELGRQALAIRADVSVEAQVIEAFAALDSQFGRLDALVNNAGGHYDYWQMALNADFATGGPPKPTSTVPGELRRRSPRCQRKAPIRESSTSAAAPAP